MTPLEHAQTLAKSSRLEDQAVALAIVTRGLSDADPADPLRQPWPVDVALLAAVRFLDLELTQELVARARVLMPNVVRTGEWCLHCGSDTCEHAVRHNTAYGRSAQ